MHSPRCYFQLSCGSAGCRCLVNAGQAKRANRQCPSERPRCPHPAPGTRQRGMTSPETSPARSDQPPLAVVACGGLPVWNRIHWSQPGAQVTS